MEYLENFLSQIRQRNTSQLLFLWKKFVDLEEKNDQESLAIVKAIRNFEHNSCMGGEIEKILPFWEKMQEGSEKDELLQYVVDIQRTNSEHLAGIVFSFLKERYGEEEFFHEFLRIVGLKNLDFNGAITLFHFIVNVKEGSFVHHLGGWGTGKVIERSLVREQFLIEFEFLSNRVDIHFQHAFKCLIPLKENHFLSRRFVDPDALEREAKKDHVSLIKNLLQDLGPKTAEEIKEELYEIVLPKAQWAKWWQVARSKMKKDSQISIPLSSKKPFYIQESTPVREMHVLKEFDSIGEFIHQLYVFFKEYPGKSRSRDIEERLISKIEDHLQRATLCRGERFSLLFFLKELKKECEEQLHNWFTQQDSLKEIFYEIPIVYAKKQFLLLLQELDSQWPLFFSEIIFSLNAHSLREFCFKSLHQKETYSLLEEKANLLVKNPYDHPEVFIWYFQKLFPLTKRAKKEANPLFPVDYGKLLEAFFLLLIRTHAQPGQRELTRKMYSLFTQDRFFLMRFALKKISLEEVKEILLLATKCSLFSEQDLIILQSLAEVTQPSLKKKKKSQLSYRDYFWTTKESYERARKKLEELSSTEIIKEIEDARQLGDLRENAEYKSAKEKAALLQREWERLMKQFQVARIITPEDVPRGEIGIGSKIQIKDEENTIDSYTLLGPWDLDVKRGILSISSDFVRAMIGLREGDSFSFQGKNYTVLAVSTFFEEVANQ